MTLRRKPSVLLLVALLLVSCTSAITAEDQPRMSEERLKASMLLQLTRFVVWPASGLSDSQIRFCVYGSDRLLESLRAVTVNETVQGKPVVVSKITRLSEFSGCDVGWLGVLSEREFESAAGTATRKAILTVSDLDSFTQRGGMVAIVPREGRMTIEVNREAGEQAGMQFSSKLLKLARLVRTAGVR